MSQGATSPAPVDREPVRHEDLTNEPQGDDLLVTVTSGDGSQFHQTKVVLPVSKTMVSWIFAAAALVILTGGLGLVCAYIVHLAAWQTVLVMITVPVALGVAGMILLNKTKHKK